VVYFSVPTGWKKHGVCYSSFGVSFGSGATALDFPVAPVLALAFLICLSKFNLSIFSVVFLAFLGFGGADLGVTDIG